MKFSEMDLEKYSSAITLSDMEIFVFPDLLYSLVLANIMSPIVWSWREDKWFRKVENKTLYRKVLRLKQFIMNNFEFNLDLETWGLTNSEHEIERFSPFIDVDIVRNSNALFGYEGDKYYFDIDIRRHFGLDKYNSNIIPYWKTETVEAMEAFKLKEDYNRAAGECVSLSTLYAAALFVVCEVPLKDIFLLATPLHSQNFISVADGILTNNRRIVTKNMLFNGSELSAKAQRALRNEQVTIVSHQTGNIHVAYDEASIDKTEYERFEDELKEYLVVDKIDYDILINFLRHHRELQSCFQIEQERHGRPFYIEAEKVFHSEHSSSYRANSDTSDQLLEEIDEFAFYTDPIDERIMLNGFEQELKEKKVDPRNPQSLQQFAESIDCPNNRSKEIAQKLDSFCRMNPRLPKKDKTFTSKMPIEIEPNMGRDGVIEHLLSMRPHSAVADLAFYAYRDLSSCEWEPFLKAALERNPVCIAGSKALGDTEVIEHIQRMGSASIYGDKRLAQPDEVWNFGTGDGMEKTLCIAAIFHGRHPDSEIRIDSDGKTANLQMSGIAIAFETSKGLKAELRLTSS